MPSFVKEYSLGVSPLADLVGRWVTCVGLGNALTQPLGYVIIWVQVDGVQGYDKDQIALVIPDLSSFAVQVPVILVTPLICHVINIIKEKEIDVLATPWVNTWMAYLLTVRWVRPSLRARGMCWHRLCTCTDACNILGQSPKRGPSTECSIRLAEGPEEGSFKSSSGRTHLQQGRPNDIMESIKFCDSPGSLISALNAQGWDWGFTTICSP